MADTFRREKVLITPRRLEFLQGLLETCPDLIAANEKVKAADICDRMGWRSSSFYSMIGELERWGIAMIYEDLTRRRHKKGCSQRRKSRATIYIWFGPDSMERLDSALVEISAGKGPGVPGPPRLEKKIRRETTKRSLREQAEWPKRVSKDIGRILEEISGVEGLPISDLEKKRKTAPGDDQEP